MAEPAGVLCKLPPQLGCCAAGWTLDAEHFLVEGELLGSWPPTEAEMSSGAQVVVFVPYMCCCLFSYTYVRVCAYYLGESRGNARTAQHTAVVLPFHCKFNNSFQNIHDELFRASPVARPTENRGGPYHLQTTTEPAGCVYL